MKDLPISNKIAKTMLVILVKPVPGQIEKILCIDLKSNSMARTTPILNNIIDKVAEGQDIHFEWVKDYFY